jgi:DNA phosphorothioation-dependent restriction protein DptG
MTICKADGTPIAMWGVTPDAGKVGRVWMLGTNELVSNRRIRLRFLREVREYLQQLFKTYAVLWNCVDARNTVHVRWIQWMGFTFVAEHPNYGAEGRLFLEFCQVSPCALQPL